MLARSSLSEEARSAIAPTAAVLETLDAQPLAVAPTG